MFSKSEGSLRGCIHSNNSKPWSVYRIVKLKKRNPVGIKREAEIILASIKVWFQKRQFPDRKILGEQKVLSIYFSNPNSLCSSAGYFLHIF